MYHGEACLTDSHCTCLTIISLVHFYVFCYACSSKFTEVGERMTKEEVLALVKEILDEARKGIESNEDSLMIGRAPFRCLGCDQLFSRGVHNKPAQKVNHQALPSSGYLSRSYVNNDLSSATLQHRGDDKLNALRPVHLGFGLRRPKISSKACQKYRPATGAEGTMKSSGRSGSL